MERKMKKKHEQSSSRIKIGPTQQKILLLLGAGVVLGLSGSPQRYFKILNSVVHDWKMINEQALRRSIKALYRSHLVKTKSNRDGTVTLVLSVEGKRRTLRYDIERLAIPNPKRWDKKWRMVTFDVPERKRRLRDEIRAHLEEMGFIEFQHSIFVHPFPCSQQINYLVEWYEARPYVRFLIAEYIDNELDLKKKFHIQ